MSEPTNQRPISPWGDDQLTVGELMRWARNEIVARHAAGEVDRSREIAATLPPIVDLWNAYQDSNHR